MNKFTPGPWQLTNIQGVVITADGYKVCDPPHGGNPGPAPKMLTDNWNDRCEMEVANAMLIATAPDMLDLLERIYAASTGPLDMLAPVLKEVQSLIVRAKGEL